MIVPSNRLLWSAALIVLPAATLAGFAPSLTCWDGASWEPGLWSPLPMPGWAPGAWMQSMPPLPRSCGSLGTFRIKLQFAIANKTAGGLTLRVAPIAPDSVQTAEPLVEAMVPAGASTVPVDLLLQHARRSSI